MISGFGRVCQGSTTAHAVSACVTKSPPPARTGRPRRHSLRTIVNAILYLPRAGCAWRLLPLDWPPWRTVCHYFRKWRLDGTWERIHTLLRRQLRVRLGPRSRTQRELGRQSVGQDHRRGRGERGYDGAKLLVGRKRHVLVDTEGLLIALNVHPANLMDRDGIKLVLIERVRARLPRMQLLWLDAGYNGRGKARTGSSRRQAGGSRRSRPCTAPRAIGCPTIFPPTKSTGPSTCPPQASMSFRAGGWW
jgi:transposase